MHGRRPALIALGMLAVMSGCSPMRGTPFDATLVGRDFYLCCTTRFDPKLSASDANYSQYRSEQHYSSGPTLAAGTRVRVTQVGGSAVAFEPIDYPMTYTISFSYGRTQESPSQYFRGILRDTDPLAALHDAPPSLGDDIRKGRLSVGMTKEQALLARGYPPARQTPNLDANEWIYFNTPGFVDRVTFAGGKIESIALGPAP